MPQGHTWVMVLGRTTDDADLPIRLHPAGARVALVFASQRIREHAARRGVRAWRDVPPGVLGPAALAVGALSFLGLMVVLSLSDAGAAAGLLVLSPVWTPLLAAGLATLTGALPAARAVAGLMKLAMLASSRCPACGYDLRGAPVAGHSTRCSECGASWRTARVGRRTPEEPEVIVVREERR